MKIGFLGNTNNYPFALATALRDLGHEIVFVVDRAEPLHRPESVDPGLRGAYGDWLHDVAPLRVRDALLPTHKNRRVIALLRDVDALVLNGSGPSFWPALRRPAIVILTGSDLDLYGDARALRSAVRSSRRVLVAALRHPLVARFGQLQRAGISGALAVEYSFPGMLPHGDALLQKLGVASDQRRCYMLTDLAALLPQPQPNNERLRIFSATRLNWVQPMPPGSSVLDAKGTDVMLRGIARWLERTGREVEVRLVKKGLHVAETIECVRALGLERRITWLEQMPLRVLHEEFMAADVVLDHFGAGSIGVAARDAMALARPVVANVKPEIFRTHLGEEIPVLQAASEVEIAAQLERLAADPALRAQLGIASRAFAERHFSPVVAARDVVATLAGAVRSRQ
ncbi:MAG TPA: glycosyltransferase [Steroidobacteraceae bacterium]|nr:glycosyltransferase [Steroidobacteraceae bacterium]